MFSKDVKEWLLAAAMNIGFDGKGKNGGAGFSERVGRKNPEALLAALTKLLPKDDVEIPTVNVQTVNIVSVEPGRFLTREQILAIEHREEMPVIAVDQDEFKRLYDLDHSARDLDDKKKQE